MGGEVRELGSQSESDVKLMRQSYCPLLLLLQLCLCWSLYYRLVINPATRSILFTHTHIVMISMYSAWKRNFCFTIARLLLQHASLSTSLSSGTWLQF